MCDHSFIKSKEFREFFINVKSTNLKRRIEEAREKVDPSLQEEIEKEEEDKIKQEIANMSLEDASTLVKGSGALFQHRCDISFVIALDAVRKVLDAFVSEESFNNNIFGSKENLMSYNL